MISEPVWIDDRRCRIGDVEFVYSTGDSTVDRFCVRKPRRLVEATIRLLREFDAPRIFELGIARGGSTALMAVAAEPAKLVAVELAEQRIEALDALIEQRGLTASVRPFYGVDQGDRVRLAALADAEFGDEPLDLVIDDASHRLEETRASFETLFPRLRPGGAYVIEDWNWLLELRFALAGSPGNAAAGRNERDADVDEPVDAGDDARRAALRSYVQQSDSRHPLETLALELVIARACSGHVVQDLYIDEKWVVVRRGPAALDPAGFRLADNYVGRAGMLGEGGG